MGCRGHTVIGGCCVLESAPVLNETTESRRVLLTRTRNHGAQHLPRFKVDLRVSHVIDRDGLLWGKVVLEVLLLGQEPGLLRA